jgi:hypothetical protein
MRKIFAVLFLSISLGPVASSWGAKNKCQAIFEGNLYFSDLVSLKADKLTDLVSKSRQIFPDFVHPSVEIIEVPGSRMDSTASTIRYLGNHFIYLSFQPYAYPLFVHEYGHVTLTATLIRDLPEMARYYEIADKIDDAIYRRDQAAMHLSHQLSAQQRQKAEVNYSNAVKDLSKWNSIRYVEARDLRAASIYFEEIFSDLLASAVYRKQTQLFSWSDGKNGESGYRDLGVLEKNPELKAAIGDPHLELQEFAAFIHAKYIAKPDANLTLIFNRLYEVIKEQLQDGMKTRWVFRTMDAIRDPRTGHTLLNGRDTWQWNQDLKKIFETKMREVGVEK